MAAALIDPNQDERVCFSEATTLQRKQLSILQNVREEGRCFFQ
jgi:hypothetical protein